MRDFVPDQGAEPEANPQICRGFGNAELGRKIQVRGTACFSTGCYGSGATERDKIERVVATLGRDREVRRHDRLGLGGGASDTTAN